MEKLPFDDESFDVVTGINSFQFAGDLVDALREARRVCRPGGTVAMLVWGRKDACDMLTKVLPPVFALLPPTPPPAAAPPALAEPGVIERLMQDAGLVPIESHEIDGPLEFPNAETAIRAIMAAMTRPIRHAGEDAVRQAVVQGLAQVASGSGPLVLNNRFRLARARRN
jgi:SAM-dependent methyltransferase